MNKMAGDRERKWEEGGSQSFFLIPKPLASVLVCVCGFDLMRAEKKEGRKGENI